MIPAPNGFVENVSPADRADPRNCHVCWERVANRSGSNDAFLSKKCFYCKRNVHNRCCNICSCNGYVYDATDNELVNEHWHYACKKCVYGLMPLLSQAAMFVAWKATDENIASLPDDLRGLVKDVKADLVNSDMYEWKTLHSSWCCTAPHVRHSKECDVCHYDFGRQNLDKCDRIHGIYDVYSVVTNYSDVFGFMDEDYSDDSDAE